MATSSRTVPASSPKATQVTPPAASHNAPDVDRAADHSQLIQEIDESGARTVIFALDRDGKTVVARPAPGAALHAQAEPTVSAKNGVIVCARVAFQITIEQRVTLLWRWLMEVFLPAGYPGSVSEDYLEYQIYDSLQAFSSSIAGLLSSRAVLTSTGVGDSSASPTAALLLSVLQESVGRIATILFAHRLGTSLEPECKAYRFAADIFNDAAMVLDCLSPAFPKPVRVAILSASSMLRALCGVAAGSAKASLSAHFAKRGNLGEVNAKDSSQETVISLLGMLAGTVVISNVTSLWATWTSLLSLLSLHLFLNYRAVRAVRMTTLNRQRANLVLSALLLPTPNQPGPRRPPTPATIAHHESILAPLTSHLRFFLPFPPHPRSLGPIILNAPFSTLASAVHADHVPLSSVLRLFAREKFVLWCQRGGTAVENPVWICVKEGAEPGDLVRAWAVAMWLGAEVREREREGAGVGEERTPLEMLERAMEEVGGRWEGMRREMEGVGWDLGVGSLETGRVRRIRAGSRKEE